MSYLRVGEVDDSEKSLNPHLTKSEYCVTTGLIQTYPLLCANTSSTGARKRTARDSRVLG